MGSECLNLQVSRIFCDTSQNLLMSIYFTCFTPICRILCYVI